MPGSVREGGGGGSNIEVALAAHKLLKATFLLQALYKAHQVMGSEVSEGTWTLLPGPHPNPMPGWEGRTGWNNGTSQSRTLKEGGGAEVGAPWPLRTLQGPTPAS